LVSAVSRRLGFERQRNWRAAARSEPDHAILAAADWPHSLPSDWPPRAVTMRVLDLDGREVHSKIKGPKLTIR